MKKKYKIILTSLAIPLSWILSLKLFFMLPISFPEDFKWFVGGTVGTLLAILITYLFSRYSKLSIRQIGLHWESKTPIRLFIGFLIGSLIALVMLWTILQLTDLEATRIENKDVLMAFFWMLALIPLAFMEEVAFRGLVLFNLEKTIGLRISLIVTSILFTYYHDLSGATFISQLLGPGVWGVIYGLSAIWSKGLAVPTGIHAGANMILASFGLKDSNYAIWMIDFSSAPSENTQSFTEMVGWNVQFFLLFIAIVLTEWYIRRRHSRT